MAATHAELITLLRSTFTECLPHRALPADDAALFGPDGALDSIDLVSFVTDAEEAVEGAEIVYAASWGSPALHAAPEDERALRDRYRDRIVTKELMARSAEGRFMHAMPIRRNVEAEDAVVDAASSLVVEQAANRLHVQRALFREVLGV